MLHIMVVVIFEFVDVVLRCNHCYSVLVTFLLSLTSEISSFGHFFEPFKRVKSFKNGEDSHLYHNSSPLIPQYFATSPHTALFSTPF